MNNKLVVDVIIPTYKPDDNFKILIEKLQKQSYPPSHILIMNTEERFFPIKEFKSFQNLSYYHVKKEEFDHGGTRDLGASMLEGDILVFMTQDAMPKDDRLIENLVRPFKDPEVGATYGRQLPTHDCREIERFTRGFNYPEESYTKTKEDIGRLGIKTYFCSNVCAAYRKKDYDKIGGFVKRTIFNEDMIYAGKLIQAGKKVAYVAEAMVIHSHNYGNIEQLRRNFDLAVSQKDHPEVFEGIKSESEGMKLVKKTACHLMERKKPWLLTTLIVNSGFKYLGFLLGSHYESLPKWFIKRCTMNRDYWNNKDRDS